jgi:hypothetical protein
MGNLETLAILGTQDENKQNTKKYQHSKIKMMSNADHT